MSLERKNILKNLPAKGFKKIAKRHHIYFHHVYHGKETGPYTYVSHSAKVKTINASLIGEMRKQLRLDRNRQVIDLCNCPMSGSDYNDVLIGNDVFERIE